MTHNDNPVRPSFELNSGRRCRGGYMAIVMVVFVTVTAILAHSALVSGERIAAGARETRLRRILAEYNCAVARFRAERGRYPASIDELTAFPGGARKIYADPAPGTGGFVMRHTASGAAFVVSSSDYKTIGGEGKYSELTADVAGKFHPYSAVTPEKMCYLGSME